MTRDCRKCKQEKPLTAFTPNKRSKLGREHTCRSCTSKHVLKWRRSNPEVYIAGYYKRTYGVDYQWYMTQLTNQEGRCAICKKLETSQNPNKSAIKRLSVDHNHVTGEVRQLLCNGCNTALGYVEEDISRLEAMIEYIKKHKNRPK